MENLCRPLNAGIKKGRRMARKYFFNFTGWTQKMTTIIRPYPSPFCGDGHFPSNGVADYDYANQTEKESSCKDWNNVPVLKNDREQVSCRN